MEKKDLKQLITYLKEINLFIPYINYTHDSLKSLKGTFKKYDGIKLYDGTTVCSLKEYFKKVSARDALSLAFIWCSTKEGDDWYYVNMKWQNIRMGYCDVEFASKQVRDFFNGMRKK